MVYARCTSSPFSMMLVASSTSPSPSAKPTIAQSIASAGMCPWAVTYLSSGTISTMRFSSFSRRAHNEALAAAPMLADQCLAYGDGIEREQEGPYCPAAHRRCPKQAHIDKPHGSGVEGARNGRCRRDQQMEPAGQLMELALLRGPKALLLVDHDEPEVLETNVLHRERMRSDHDPKAAVRKRLPHAPCLGRPHESGQVADFYPGVG